MTRPHPFKEAEIEERAKEGGDPRAVHPPMRPRDAATLIIVDASSRSPVVLMGQRRPDLKFMPGKFVFPGGRLDMDDKVAPAASELTAIETARLLYDMKGRPSPARARGLAMTAVRETFEEAGLVLGCPSPSRAVFKPRKSDAPAARTWAQYLEHGCLPDLSRLTLIARAITPPGRPRRFDTRFFCVERTAIAKAIDHLDGELSGLVWKPLEETRSLDLPPITRTILEILSERLADRSLADPSVPIPYFFNRHGTFRRELIEVGR